MKPTKMKSSGELEEYIAELKEQLKQAKLDKREALAREQKQAREWRTDLAHTLGETVLTVTGCDWTRLDLEALEDGCWITPGRCRPCSSARSAPPRRLTTR